MRVIIASQKTKGLLKIVIIIIKLYHSQCLIQSKKEMGATCYAAPITLILLL